MYKSYYKQGYQPATKYRKAQRYIKNRVAQNIAQSRGPMIPRQITIYKKSGETKGMDTDIGNDVGSVVTTTTTNDDIVVLNLIQAGNGSWNRVGKKVSITSLRLVGSITSKGEGGACAVRMAVVWDKQPSGNTIPKFNDIFGRTDQNGNETSEVFDPLRYDNVGRFKLLLDRKIEFNPGNDKSNTKNVTKCIDEYLQLKNKETIFSGNSTPMTIADISTGGLYIVFRYYNTDLDSEVTVETNFMSRLRYTD